MRKVIVSIWTDYEGDCTAVYVGREGERECERGDLHRGTTFLDDRRWCENEGIERPKKKTWVVRERVRR